MGSLTVYLNRELEDFLKVYREAYNLPTSSRAASRILHSQKRILEPISVLVIKAKLDQFDIIDAQVLRNDSRKLEYWIGFFESYLTNLSIRKEKLLTALAHRLQFLDSIQREKTNEVISC